jgi:hypothetical protein
VVTHTYIYIYITYQTQYVGSSTMRKHRTISRKTCILEDVQQFLLHFVEHIFFHIHRSQQLGHLDCKVVKVALLETDNNALSRNR